MAAIKLHQTGTHSLTGSSGTETITAVDRTKSFLVFSTRIDSARPDEQVVSGQLTADTTITFVRTSSTGTVEIRWFVVEFSSGVSVQRGSHTWSDPLPNAVTLGTPADEATSFIIWSQRESGGSLNGDDFCFATLNDIDADSDYEEIVFDSDALAPVGVAEWQVVTYDDCAVQTGTISYISSDTSKTDTLSPAVDQAKTWLICSGWESDHTSASDPDEDFWRGRITSTTEITFDRTTAPTTGSGTIAWFTVDFSDNTLVDEIAVAFGTGDTTVNDTATESALGKSIVTAAGFLGHHGKTAYAADDNMAPAGGTLDLTTTTNLQTVRQITGSSTTDLTAYVVAFQSVEQQILRRRMEGY